MANEYQYLPFEVDGTQYAVPLKYIASILLSSEEFPTCVPPKRNACVVRVMRVNQELMTIVELAALGKKDILQERQPQRPFVLSLRYQGSLIGLLVDRVSSLLTVLEPKLSTDSVNQRTLLISDTGPYVLFDVSELHEALSFA